MLRIISMSFSLIAVISVYIVTNVIPFNGKTTLEIMNRLPVLFTPAKLCIYHLGFYLYSTCRLALRILAHKNKRSKSILNLRAFLFILSSYIKWFMDCSLALWILQLDFSNHGSITCNTHCFLFYVS